MRLKKVMATGLVAALALSTMVGCSSKKDSSDQKKIGVVQLVEHDALDASYKGFKDGLEKAGYKAVSYTHQELGTSVITNITEIALDGDKVTAKQETEEGYRTVEASAPCVVTVTKPEYDPRYPTIKNKMAARKKPIGDIKEADLADLEKEKVGESNAKVQIVKLYEPAKKEAGIKIQEETPEDSAIKAVAMMADAKVF